MKITINESTLALAVENLSVSQCGKMLLGILDKLNGDVVSCDDAVVNAKLDFMFGTSKVSGLTKSEYSKSRSEIAKKAWSNRTSAPKEPEQKDIKVPKEIPKEPEPIKEPPPVVVNKPEPVEEKKSMQELHPPIGGHELINGHMVYRRQNNKIFVAPTQEEVDALIKERGYHFKAEHFIQYYQDDDWHRGEGTNRVPVSNWKRCAGTFEQAAIRRAGRIAINKPYQQPQQRVDYAHMDLSNKTYDGDF